MNKISLNWLIADKEGNIGYYHVGRIPDRAEGIDLRLPTPGTGEYDWQGFQDPADNPSVVNPESGFVANWNNKPALHWNNHERSFVWGGDHRVQQFIDRTEAVDALTLKKMDQINYQASLVTLQTRWFKPYLLDVLRENREKHRVTTKYISI